MELTTRFSLALTTVVLLWTSVPSAESVVVRHVEGLVHGFLSLRSPEGSALATRAFIEGAQGDRITSRLGFRFKDGSLNDETGICSQRGHFRMLSHHLVQRGPAFEQPLDMTIDGPTGHVTVRDQNDHGEEKVEDEQMNRIWPTGGSSPCSRMCGETPYRPVCRSSWPRPTATGEVTHGRRGHRSVFGLPVSAQSHTLCVESRHWRSRRLGRPARGEATSGLPCLDTRGGSPGRRAVASADVHGRTGLADRPCESRLAPRAMSLVNVGPVAASIEHPRR
jgi:hypothetical protein